VNFTNLRPALSHAANSSSNNRFNENNNSQPRPDHSKKLHRTGSWGS